MIVKQRHPACQNFCISVAVNPLQVGTVGGGVAAAAWSPDAELLALVSEHGQLLLMNKVLLLHLIAISPKSYTIQ